MKKLITNSYFRAGLVGGFCVVALWLACSSIEGPRFITAKELENRFDFKELTPIEIKQMEKVLNSQVSPCGDDITLAEALFNPEHCPLAPLAGRFVMLQVMEDYNAEEVAEAYVKRYAAVKGLEIPEDGSPRKGAKKPIATLVVFTDFECPFCSRAAFKIHELLRRYPEEIALVHKNYPIAEIHKTAELTARAGFAAHRQGEFWKMHDTMFSASGALLDRARIETMAKGLGLDVEKFMEDMDSEAAVTAIKVDKKLAEQLGVTGTPTMFLNGRLVENGLRGLEVRLEEEFLRHAVLTK